VNKVSLKLQSMVKILIAIILTAMFVISMAQIIGRFVFFYSLPWSEELSVYLFLWLIFLAASISIKEGNEIRIDLINFKDEKKNEFLMLFRNIAALAVILVFLVSSFTLTQNAFTYAQLSSSLRISMGFIYLAMPIGFILMGLETFLNIINNINKIRGIKVQTAERG